MLRINAKTIKSFLIGYAIYIALALFSVMLARASQNVAVFWPANAVIVLMCIANGRAQLPAFILAAFCANATIQIGFGDPLLMIVGFPLANCLEILVAYFGLQLLQFDKTPIDSPKKAMSLLGVVSVAAMPAAAIGSTVVSLVHGGSPFGALINWWAGDIVSAMIIYLPVLSMRAENEKPVSFANIRMVDIRDFARLCFSFVLGFLVLSALTLPLALILLFPTLWLALKGRPFQVALISSILSLAISGAAVIGVLPGISPDMALRDIVFQQQTLALFCTFPPFLIAVTISNFTKSQTELAQRHEALTITLSHMQQGVSVFDRDGKLTVWNEKYLQIFGVDPKIIFAGVSFQAILDQQNEDGKFNGDPAQIQSNILAHVNRGTELYTETKMTSGRYIRSVHSPTPVGGWIGTHEDITEKRMLADKLAYDALHDVLTDIPNRRYFEKEFAGRLRVAQGEKSAVTLFSIDLDNFKKINDTHGHEVGDEILKWAAQNLERVKRKGDFLARVGGDEFMLIASKGTDPKTAENLGKRINESFGQAVEMLGVTCLCNVSIGIAHAADGQVSARQLLSQADVAVYAAKKKGRGRYQLYDFSKDENRDGLIAS
ncbi:diguanylate cyclase domain-containing protein [Maritalea sp.]|uniref:sensor domain-containing diguanylate cyclase n=1 Tax=Maritalea sp. TaxID=2003361 RepID=UPI003EF9EF19